MPHCLTNHHALTSQAADADPSQPPGGRLVSEAVVLADRAPYNQIPPSWWTSDDPAREEPGDAATNPYCIAAPGGPWGQC